MRMRLAARAARGMAIAVGLLALSTASASSAQAASPGWKVLGVTSPTNLPPRQSEVQRVTVEAQAGSFTLSRATGQGQGNLSYGEGFAFYGDEANEFTILFGLAGAFAVGQEVAGPEIAAGTTVTSVSPDGMTIGLSQPTEGEAFGTVSAASKEVTGLTSVSGEFRVGDSITGPGIPAGTTATAVSGATLTLSAFPTQSGLNALQASETTAPIDFDAQPGDLQSALEALPAHPAGSLAVTGGPGGDEDHPYFVEFGGPLADQDVTQFTATGSFPEPGERVVVATTVPGGPGQGAIRIHLTNVGGAASDGTETLTVGPLPAGITVSGPPLGGEGGSPAALAGWSCPGVGAGATQFNCSRISPLASLYEAKALYIPVTVDNGAAASSSVPVRVEGGGSSRVEETEVEVTVSSEPARAGIQALWAGAFDDEGNPSVQAGGHPYSAGASFVFNKRRLPTGAVLNAGDPHDLTVDLPPGFAGNPMVTPRCPALTPYETGVECTAASRVGETFVNEPATLEEERSYMTSSVPSHGWAAQFSFVYSKVARISVGAYLRSDEDFGASVLAPNIAQDTVPVFKTTTILRGHPEGAEGKAFLTNPSNCAEQAQTPPVTRVSSDFWQERGVFDEALAPIPPVVGCENLEFTPGFTLQPSATTGSTPVATEARLTVDQARLLEPDELAPPHLKRSVVTLPEGLNLNPSAANGLAACSTDQMGYKGGNFPAPNPTRFDKEPVSCPDASKVGTAEVTTPLLEEPLAGTVYLAKQGDNPFNSLIALYIVVEDEQTGITVKLPGKVTPNPSTGQLTAEFDNNPQVPFEELKLNFRGGGPRSTLATPDVCGTHETKGSWTPWSAPESGPPAQTTDSFEIAGNCAPSKAQRPFDLGLTAGVTDPVAGKHSPFVLRLTRPDGNQELDTVEAAMPPGFTATLKGVATCTDAQLGQALSRSNPGDGKAEISSPSCPASSQIGTTKIGAGVGPEPIYVDGKAYLTGPYKGAPVSLSFVVPAVAGPFDLGVQVVRTALNVDPKTAQITAVSDPVPQILSGIPVQIKDVRVNIDRNAFTLNPTSCEQMQIDAKVTGGSGATANLSNRFQVGNCAALGFEPRTNVRLFGGIARGKYQGVRAVVRPRPGDANISRTVVRFPRSAFVAQEHLKDICTRVQYAADACPKRSVYGRAIAYSPLLDEPLRGNVYLRSSDNALPDLVADLRGPAHQPIRVEVAVRNDSVKGALRNTVQAVPDAPVSYFRLQTFGKSKGLIVNSRNICKGKNQARVAMAAHNGRRSVQNVNVFNKRCKAYKRKLRKAKRKAKRSAHRSKLRASAGRGR